MSIVPPGALIQSRSQQEPGLGGSTTPSRSPFRICSVIRISSPRLVCGRSTNGTARVRTAGTGTPKRTGFDGGRLRTAPGPVELAGPPALFAETNGRAYSPQATPVDPVSESGRLIAAFCESKSTGHDGGRGDPWVHGQRGPPIGIRKTVVSPNAGQKFVFLRIADTLSSNLLKIRFPAPPQPCRFPSRKPGRMEDGRCDASPSSIRRVGVAKPQPR